MPTVLWLTNLPAPYRIPIWDRIASQYPLHVKFLLKNDNWRNWQVPEGVEWQSEHLSLFSLKLGEYDFIPSLRGARRVLRNIDTVVVGGWEVPFYIFTIFLAKKRHIPMIHFYESTDSSHRFKGHLIRKIRSFVLSQADFVVTTGFASTNAVLNMGIAREKIVTLFNPVDVNWFHKMALIHRTPATPGHKFLFVGRLIELKNLKVLIEAFVQIRQESDTLTIVGEGELSRQLEDLASSKGVANSVHFLGYKKPEDLTKIYASNNTLILPSTNEVWGLVVNEALASGLHIVVSDKCGVSKFIQKMRGCYISQTDSLSIARSMKRSRADWTGYVSSPEIMNYTPERFADEIIKICF